VTDREILVHGVLVRLIERY